MLDPLTVEQRRKVMRSNKSKGTKLELAVRRGLYARGLRYRLHGPKSIGSPDIVFKGRKAVVFVHGCFWHQHSGCAKAAKVGGDSDAFWAAKFAANIARDRLNIETAKDADYRIAVIWECSVEQKKRKSAKREKSLDSLAEWLFDDNKDKFLEI